MSLAVIVAVMPTDCNAAFEFNNDVRADIVVACVSDADVV